MERIVTCTKCGSPFTVSEGGGFFFHLLHCDKCGKEKSVGFDELGDAHFGFLKGIAPAPYSDFSASMDRQIQETYEGPVLDRKEYNEVVEEFAGMCKCGGHFKLHAPPRCPVCQSSDYYGDSE